MHRVASTIVATMCVLLVNTACRDTHEQPLQITNAWMRTADSGSTTAAYMTLHNSDRSAVTIVAVTSPVASLAGLHETSVRDGLVTMSARSDLTMAPDSTLSLTPGSLHIMLTNVHRTLHAGDTISLRFTLRDRPPVTTLAVVRAP